MTLASLGAYSAPDHTPRRIVVLVLGPPSEAAGPAPAVLAARLAAHPALVLDRSTDASDDVRVVGELRAGEGIAAVRALIADYLPRARRATKPLARQLDSADLLVRSDATGVDGTLDEDAPWAA